MKFKQLLLAVAGIVCLVSGMTLVLAWWPDVVRLFRGVMGMGLALAGMLMLFLTRE